MHDDLIDAVDWAIAEGIADPARVAIYGASYGGYAVLVGATFTPEKFAGANDVRVVAAESEQIVAAMQRRNIPVTYLYYTDEGHGFYRPENRRSFTAVAEAFLAQHLGGCVEPVVDDFAGSSIQFKAGRDLISGLG